MKLSLAPCSVVPAPSPAPAPASAPPTAAAGATAGAGAAGTATPTPTPTTTSGSAGVTVTTAGDTAIVSNESARVSFSILPVTIAEFDDISERTYRTVCPASSLHVSCFTDPLLLL